MFSEDPVRNSEFFYTEKDAEARLEILQEEDEAEEVSWKSNWRMGKAEIK